MKNSSASIVLGIALSLATTLFLTVAAGSIISPIPPIIECKGVPSMPVAVACGKVSGGSKRMAKLCAKVLRTAPANSETTVYASKALGAAEASAAATYRLIGDQLSHNESLIDPVRSSYDDCQDLYKRDVMADIGAAKELMKKCHFQEVVSGVDGIDICLQHDRRRSGEGTTVLPLYDKMLADRDTTVLASLLLVLTGNGTLSSIDLAAYIN